jgi:hypothetical protein
MSRSEPPESPITESPGHSQGGVDPIQLRPSRHDLSSSRLEVQRALIRAGRPRFTPILVTSEGVIVDGHHAVRAAAEERILVDVTVSPLPASRQPGSILDLPLR